MRIAGRMWLAGLAILTVASIPTLSRGPLGAPQAAGSGSDVPVVDSGVGPCTADFVVGDPSGKGIYDAKIDIQIRYGFMGLHKLEATVGTNSEGKARIIGLPEQIKRPAEFDVSHGGESKSITYDPLVNCHPRLNITLTEK